MSCSKPLQPFIFDLLCYLNREQLEQFSIVCRPFKNIIDRYFYSKPYRVFDRLGIYGGSYSLYHNRVYWHPNREDYSVQKFLARQECSVDKSEHHQNDDMYYSFPEMRPYLGPTIRINWTIIYVPFTFNPEHISEMESIAYLWRDSNIFINKNNARRIRAEDFESILNSPTILQYRKLYINNAHFSFKDYKVLYTVKLIDTYNDAEEKIDPSYWTEFLEQPEVKPLVVLRYARQKNTENLLNRLSKAFSSSVTTNAFKIVFCYVYEPLTEFRETNKTLAEKLELKKGLSTNCESIDAKDFDENYCYTLERSSI